MNALLAAYGSLVHPNVQCFLPNIFCGVFGRAKRYLDWLCCVALRCDVALHFVVCLVLCRVVICLLFVSKLLFFGLKFLSFPVPL